MKVALLLFLAAPAWAQFRSIEITFEGIGCASCMESMPSRMQRLRGVESATVDAQRGVLKIQLAEQNRVRLEQVRDMIEQDGTKTKAAKVTLKGELKQVDGKWVLQPASVPTSYAVVAPKPAAGTYVASGDVEKMHPESGGLVITVTALSPAQ